MSVPRSITARIDGQRPGVGIAPARRLALAGAGGISAASLLAFALLWMPSPFKLGEFSLAFTMPFLLAAWVLLTAAPADAPGRALRGDSGRGLWIETLCMLIVILCASLSMLASPEPLRAFRVILPMTYGLCGLFIMTRLSALAARRLIYAIVWSGVFVTAVAVVMLHIPALRLAVQVGYRFKGFFENSNQLALSVTAMWPLLVVLALTARSAALKLLCVAGLAILAYALLLSGAKTGLALTFAATCVTLLYHSSRTGSLDSSFLSVALVVALMALAIPLLLAIFAWASPIAFTKLQSIFVGGVSDYSTIRSRDLLWSESLRIGFANPLLGEGAGTRILDKAHSHNMVLDYFRGMGVFAMAAAVILLVTVVTRALLYLAATWGKGRENRAAESITMALHLGAATYLIGNQISDSFSPSTAFLFWAVYLAGCRSALPRVARIASDNVERPAAWVARSPAQRWAHGGGAHPA